MIMITLRYYSISSHIFETDVHDFYVYTQHKYMSPVRICSLLIQWNGDSSLYSIGDRLEHTDTYQLGVMLKTMGFF